MAEFNIMLKKYWLHILILVSVFTAVVALLNDDTLNALYYKAVLFVLVTSAGMMTARFFYNWLKKRFHTNA